jgi:hypothetical protein
METTLNASRGLRISMRLYQAILTVYPTEFRQAYGGPMLQVFGDCCRRAFVEGGTAGLLTLWWRTLLDTIQTAIEEHSQRGINMSKSTFVKISGWALILSGIAFVIGSFAGSRPEYNQYNALSQPIDYYANMADFPLISMAFLLLVIGYIGLFVRYGQSVSSFGRISLIIGILSAVVGLVGHLILNIVYNDWNETWNTVVNTSFTLQFIGLLFFGISSYRQCALSRWKGLPILAGIWIPAQMVGNIIMKLVNEESTLDAVAMFTLVISMAGLIGLGYLLLTDAERVEITGAAA